MPETSSFNESHHRSANPTFLSKIIRRGWRHSGPNHEGLPTKLELNEEEERHRRIRFCIMLLLVYFGIGTIGYTVIFESWTFTDACYFSMVTLMTVGYGVITPTNESSRAFTIFFILGGISMVSLALVEVGEFFAAKRAAAQKQLNEQIIQSAAAKMLTGEQKPVVVPGADTASDQSAPSGRLQRSSSVSEKVQEAQRVGQERCDRVHRWWETSPYTWLLRHKVFVAIVKMFVFQLIFGAIFIAVENHHVAQGEDDAEEWTFLDGMYFIMVTGSTVGYGDVTPVSNTGKWLNLLFIPCAVVFISTQFDVVATNILGHDEDVMNRIQQLLGQEMTLESLLAMDQDGDGEISEFEFIRFMLTRTEMCGAEILDQLHEQFIKVDTDGSGVLTKEDLLDIQKKMDDRNSIAGASDVAVNISPMAANSEQEELGLPVAMVQRHLDNPLEHKSSEIALGEGFNQFKDEPAPMHHDDL